MHKNQLNIMRLTIIGICLLFGIQVCVEASVIGHIQFLQFRNPTNKDFDGNNCDSLLIDSECDVIFNFNISMTPKAPCQGNVCLYRFIGNPRKEVEDDKGVVDMQNDDTGIPNTIKVKWQQWKGGFQINLVAIDKDRISLDELVDIHNVVITDNPQASLSVARYSTHISTGIRKLYKTKLSVRVRLFCADNYYGSDCSTYCNPKALPNRYSCDRSGKKKCLKGWYGNECSVYCLATATSHFRCDTNGKKVCNPGWTGSNCKKRIPTSTTIIITKSSSLFSSIYTLTTSSSIASTQWTFQQTTDIKMLHPSSVISSFKFLHDKTSTFISPSPSSSPLSTELWTAFGNVVKTTKLTNSPTSSISPSSKYRTLVKSLSSSVTAHESSSALLLVATSNSPAEASSSSPKLSRSSSQFQSSSSKVATSIRNLLPVSSTRSNSQSLKTKPTTALPSSQSRIFEVTLQSSPATSSEASKTVESKTTLNIHTTPSKSLPRSIAATSTIVITSNLAPPIKENREFTMDSDIMRGTVSGVGLLILLIIVTLIYVKCRTRRSSHKETRPIKSTDTITFKRFSDDTDGSKRLEENIEMTSIRNPVYFSGLTNQRGNADEFHVYSTPEKEYEFMQVPPRSSTILANRSTNNLQPPETVFKHTYDNPIFGHKNV